MTVFGATLYAPPISVGTTTWQTTDEFGVDWICEDLTGWADLPESSVGVYDRVFAHGAWTAPGWYGARPLTLTGVLLAPDRAALQAALHRLRATHYALVVGALTLTVDELDGSRSLSVRAASATFDVVYLLPSAARVTVELVAGSPTKRGAGHSETTTSYRPGVGRHYPRKVGGGDATPSKSGWWTYGAAGVFGNITAANDGNAPWPPVFTFTGPLTRPTVFAPDLDRFLAFDITLVAGDVLVADADTHAVVLNTIGNRRSVLTPDSAWFDLPPGETLLQFRPADGDGSVTVTWSDGWW